MGPNSARYDLKRHKDGSSQRWHVCAWHPSPPQEKADSSNLEILCSSRSCIPVPASGLTGHDGKDLVSKTPTPPVSKNSDRVWEVKGERRQWKIRWERKMRREKRKGRNRSGESGNLKRVVEKRQFLQIYTVDSWAKELLLGRQA